MTTTDSLTRVLADIRAERERQDVKFGDQSYPDGTALPGDREASDRARQWCDDLAATGEKTWRDILTEEVLEAYAENHPVWLRPELVQAAAVLVAWIQDLDERGKDA